MTAILIPSQSQGNPGGFVYTWEDRLNLVPGTTYFYWSAERMPRSAHRAMAAHDGLGSMIAEGGTMYRQLTILSLCLALAAGLTGAWLAPRVQVVLCHWTGSLSTALVGAEPSFCRYSASLHWSHHVTWGPPT